MNYYEILLVLKTATQKEIKHAYRKLAMIKHPDRGGSVEEFKLIQKAYSILSDPVKRAQYDENGEAHEDFIVRNKIIVEAVKIFTAVIESRNDLEQDIIQLCKNIVKNTICNIQDGIRDIEKQKGKLEISVSKLKCESEESILLGCLKSRIMELDFQINGLKESCRQMGIVLQIFDKHSWVFTEKKYQQTIYTGNSFGNYHYSPFFKR